jgi:hypothetical protein
VVPLHQLGAAPAGGQHGRAPGRQHHGDGRHDRCAAAGRRPGPVCPLARSLAAAGRRSRPPQPRQRCAVADTSAPAARAGALAGALHGCEWIPGSWYDDLENGVGGRDEVVEVARQLALLDCSDVFPLQPSNEQLRALVQQLHDRMDEEAPAVEEQLKQGLAQMKAQQAAAAAAGGGGKHL